MFKLKVVDVRAEEYAATMTAFFKEFADVNRYLHDEGLGYNEGLTIQLLCTRFGCNDIEIPSTGQTYLVFDSEEDAMLWKLKYV